MPHRCSSDCQEWRCRHRHTTRSANPNSGSSGIEEVKLGKGVGGSGPDVHLDLGQTNLVLAQEFHKAVNVGMIDTVDNFPVVLHKFHDHMGCIEADVTLNETL